VTGNHELLKLNVFSLGKGEGEGGEVRDYLPPVNSSEFLVCLQSQSFFFIEANRIQDMSLAKRKLKDMFISVYGDVSLIPRA